MAEKDIKRALAFLSAGKAVLCEAAAGTRIVLDAGERGCISVARDALKAMAASGLVVQSGTSLALSEAGRARRRRDAAGADGYQAQHRTPTVGRSVVDGVEAITTINLDESPLQALARRKGRDGLALLSQREVAAGERLRGDYTRGQIMPRLGANWEAAVASGRRDGGAGGMAELTDAALAARMRVERALDAVGPELAGLLVDVCCFLKGLETVERERAWPARSAKILLRTALGMLARHYEPPAPRRDRRSILHWGAEGFRPSLESKSLNRV